MKKKILISLFVPFMPLLAMAQLYQDASNSTAVVVRDPARHASTDVDAVIYNPAGLAFMKDGFHISLNGNGSFTRVVGWDGVYNAEEGQFEGNMLNSYNIRDVAHDNVRKVIPSFQLSYKKSKWAFGLSLAEEGGFGNWSSQTGLNDFDRKYASTLNESLELLPVLWASIGLLGALQSVVFPAMPESLSNCHAEVAYNSGDNANLYNYSARLMAAFRIAKNVSFSAGVRINRFSYAAIKGSKSVLVKNSLTSEVWSAQDYYSTVVNELEKWSSEHNQEAESLDVPKIISLVKESERNASSINDLMQIESIVQSTNGWGFFPILGLDFMVGNVNLGAKYEFGGRTIMSETEKSYIIPPLLSVGADWKIRNDLSVALGGVMHFKTTDYDSYNGTIMSNSKTVAKVSVSGTWLPTRRLSVSVGETYANLGYIVPSLYSAPFVFLPNSQWKTSAGIAFAFTDNLSFEAGFSYSYLNPSHVRNMAVLVNFDGYNPARYYDFFDRAQTSIGIKYNF